MEWLTAAREANNRLRLVRSSTLKGWARHGTTLKGSSGESDGDPLAHAALDREQLHRDRGAEQPGAQARRGDRRRAEHAQTGQGGVAVHPADAWPRAEQRIRFAEIDPAL